MGLIDLHCDTIWKVTDLDKKGDLWQNQCSISIPGMQEADTLLQTFACFIYTTHMEGNSITEQYESGYRHAWQMIEWIKNQIENYKEYIAPVQSRADITNNRKQGKISAMLSLEEGGVLNGCGERVEELHREGIRMMTLLWNHENCIGYPNSREQTVMEQGLKPFGAEVVERMNDLDMIIDVSHASDGSFRDVLRHSKKPVIASHSNCRSVCNHPRNLSDDMIRALAEKGGIAGLNFYGPFLGSPRASRIEEMIFHLKHMIKVGGSDFPAIGTDFDGFDGMDSIDIPKVEHMQRLLQAMEQSGFTTKQIEKIWWKNAWRVLAE